MQVNYVKTRIQLLIQLDSLILTLKFMHFRNIKAVKLSDYTLLLNCDLFKTNPVIILI